MANLVGPNCIIQGTLGAFNHKNLEAVLFRDGQLHHVFGAAPEQNNKGLTWSYVQALPTQASGPGSLIQSSIGSGRHKNFEVVLWAGNELWHWFHDNSDVGRPWEAAERITDRATGPGSIIQSDFGTSRHKNFEVVALEGNQLVHYMFDHANAGLGWQFRETISTRATGPGCIIQSDFLIGGRRRLDVVALEGNELSHYFLNASRQWIRAGVITVNATGPGSIIQGPFGRANQNFEVVVPERHQLVHYFFDHSHSDRGWQRGQVVSVAATGPGCIARSDFGPGGPGNFEVLASELSRSVVHYWHHNVDTRLPWWRLPDPMPSFGEPREDSDDVLLTTKVAQLTGEFDRQDKELTLNRTESRFGVVGTDLGQSFEHEGRLVFLFGDTKTDGVKRPEPTGHFDSIAFTSDTDPSGGIRLDFNPTFPRVDDIDQSGFCVPADGISINGRMYVFFTTDRIDDPDVPERTMGRSVLARSDDGGIHFGRSLFDLSRDKFINLSLQRVANEDFPGLPDDAGDGVLLWGSGGYRRSNVHLAYVPLARFENRSAYRFFIGLDHSDRPLWSADEAQAEPLFLSGTVGELCVRWNPFLRRFIMLYNSRNPRFILERQAILPWGPWSHAENILNSKASFGKNGFIHQVPDDGLSDEGPDEGDPYGPYLISRYTRQIDAATTEMYFVLSVWNPYNTMLMRGTFRAREVPGQPALRQSRHSGPFTQSTFGRQGNFEVVVPQGDDLVHYFRDNDAPGFPWHRFGTLPGVGGTHPAFQAFPISATLIQGNFGIPGNLELIARMRRVTRDDDFLTSYFFESRTLTWVGPIAIVADGKLIDGVTGNPALIQSQFGRKGNFEVVVPQHGLLMHYFRDNDADGLPWHHFAKLPGFGGPFPALRANPVAVALLESTFGTYEAIVRVRQATRDSDFLQSYFFDSGSLKWSGPFNLVVEGQLIDGVTGDPVVLQSTFGRKGDFELVVPQRGRLVHYFRDNDANGLPWRRSGALIPKFGGDFPSLLPVPTGVALCQSNFKDTGNLEAVVRMRWPIHETDFLAFQSFDSQRLTWSAPRNIVADGQLIRGVTPTP